MRDTVKWVIGLLGLSALIAGAIWFYYYEKKKKETNTTTPAINYAGEKQIISDNNMTLTPEFDTENTYDMVDNVKPANQKDEQWAPIGLMSQNSSLSQANAENAQWSSASLLPNADLQCNRDGMISDGPTFEELKAYTPDLMKASQASQYFMDPPSVNRFKGSDILRPLPIIGSSAGSRENLVWSVSSTQQSDLAQLNAGQQSLFCQ